MALAELLDSLNAQLVTSHQQSMSRIGIAGENATQGLTVVNTALIQAQGSVSDDPGLIAALQTASRSPIQGSNDKIA